MASLTQAQIDALIAKIQYYKYQVAFGDQILGPIASAPKVEADIETKDTIIYETGTDAQATLITKNNAKITIDLEDIDAGMTLLGAFRKGDNILATESAKALTLVPLTDDAGAKTLTFPNCYLQPGLSTTFQDGDDPNSVTLSFIARPTAENGELYTFA